MQFKQNLRHYEKKFCHGQDSNPQPSNRVLVLASILLLKNLLSHQFYPRSVPIGNFSSCQQADVAVAILFPHSSRIGKEQFYFQAPCLPHMDCFSVK